MVKCVYYIGTKPFSSAENADKWAKEAGFKKEYVIVSKGGGYTPLEFYVAIKQRL